MNEFIGYMVEKMNPAVGYYSEALHCGFTYFADIEIAVARSEVPKAVAVITAKTGSSAKPHEAVTVFVNAHHRVIAQTVLHSEGAEDSFISE